MNLLALELERLERDFRPVERLFQVLVRGAVVASGQRLALARRALAGVGAALALDLVEARIEEGKEVAALA